jgi:hypothetical protein
MTLWKMGSKLRGPIIVGVHSLSCVFAFQLATLALSRTTLLYNPEEARISYDYVRYLLRKGVTRRSNHRKRSTRVKQTYRYIHTYSGLGPYPGPEYCSIEHRLNHDHSGFIH